MAYPIFVFVLFVAVIIFTVIKLANVYTISVAEFKSIFSGMNDSRLIDVTTRGPNHTLFKYQIYPIDIIQCYDKKGNIISLKNGPALEIQFTDVNNKKTSFYFDSIRSQENIVTGSQSRYLNPVQKTVDLNAVTKIEIRNIKKGLKYINQLSI